MFVNVCNSKCVELLRSMCLNRFFVIHLSIGQEYNFWKREWSKVISGNTQFTYIQYHAYISLIYFKMASSSIPSTTKIPFEKEKNAYIEIVSVKSLVASATPPSKKKVNP